MTIEISNNNGASWVLVRSVTYQGTENSWQEKKIYVGNIITPTATMRVRFSTADLPNNSITESAIDAFRVRLLRCN